MSESIVIIVVAIIVGICVSILIQRSAWYKKYDEWVRKKVMGE